MSLALGQTPTRTPEPPKALGIEQGALTFQTADFDLKLLRSSQTVAALLPRAADGFDFTPADWLERRASDGFYHLGDIRFSLRMGSSGEWRQFSTATARRAVTPVDVKAPDLAAADLAPTLPSDCPLKVIRRWTVNDGRLTLRFEFENKTDQPIELGAVGIAMVFNNILTGRSLAEAHEKCSFSDPYIGLDAGYIQVTRLKGVGPALVVVPDGKTPFEAYQLLREPARPQQTAEGMFEWLVHSKAYAEHEWKNAKPWNEATSEILPPQGRRQFGVKFLVADRIQTIENTLAAASRPVAVGMPGYIAPRDLKSSLFVKYASPVKSRDLGVPGVFLRRGSKSPPSVMKSLDVEPAGSLRLSLDGSTRGWEKLGIVPNGWGRSRLTITYADGNRQSVHYYITKPAAEAVSDLGRFLFSRQWYENTADPFGRAPSVMSYDREANKIVDQDTRVWIAGLGDEGGSGSWLAAAMKEFVKPDAREIEKLEHFIDRVLWGGIQYKDGSNKYGVRKSLLFYGPDQVPGYQYDKTGNWTTWTSWKKDQAESIGRGYNYPHVVAAYWSMYRTARNHPGMVRSHMWDWYLNQAFETTKFLFSRDDKGKRRVGYVELGLMEGTIFLELLKDLRREAWTDKAAEVERIMKERADTWQKFEYPFGSEMAWDSTGQEEVYDWCDYFGYDDKAMVSLNSIIGYMPTLPHWGYNGNARRYWDFLYAAKLRRIERQIHHYGSGLNAIPVLSYYREHPDDFYMLRVGYGGMMGALSNIDQEGFASAAFHTYPDTLKWDAYSGDYGPNFFGHAMNAATYVVKHPEFGWQSFGGSTVIRGSQITVAPLDAMRRRVYIAPFGLWLSIDAGVLRSVVIDEKNRSVTLDISGTSGTIPLLVEQSAKLKAGGVYRPQVDLPLQRGAYQVTLTNGAARVRLTLQK